LIWLSLNCITHIKPIFIKAEIGAIYPQFRLLKRYNEGWEQVKMGARWI